MRDDVRGSSMAEQPTLPLVQWVRATLGAIEFVPEWRVLERPGLKIPVRSDSRTGSTRFPAPIIDITG